MTDQNIAAPSSGIALAGLALPAGLQRISVAPMMEWTDRHCRSFHRLISSQAWLYTEMVTAQAIVHGDPERLLGRGEEGGRVVLQLGGNDPALLARAARSGLAFGYDEINLNCGCPSDRVREGAFGACLMADPARVADCVAAMSDAVPIPVTVKHRIGIDRCEDYDFVRNFVAQVAAAGCRRFIVHARNAWLDGLDPKQNREIPPLRYEVVHRLQLDFPGLAFELNGGLQDLASGLAAAQGVAGQPALNGIMYGRRAYHDPWLLSGVDRCLEPQADRPPPTRAGVVERLVSYLERHACAGVSLRHMARHVLGLYHGQPAARLWRRQLSDSQALARNDPGWLLEVCRQVEAEAAGQRQRLAARPPARTLA